MTEMPSEQNIPLYLSGMKSPYRKELALCLRAVLRSGNRLVRRDFDLNPEDKPNEFVGTNSMVTSADAISHGIIFDLLEKEAPQAYILAEEARRDERNVLTESDYKEKILAGSDVVSIDELDGTSSYAWDTSTWAIHFGYQRGTEHLAGAQYMPAINGGLLVYAAKGGGCWEVSGYYGGPKRASVSSREIPDHQKVGWYGPDSRIVKHRPLFGRFLDELTDKMRTPMINGSCGYGLALAATGRTHLSFQPPQFIYDWHQGYTCVTEAGGKMLFFTTENEKLQVHEKPAIEMYNPARKIAGFLAGEAKTVDRYAVLLQGLCGKQV